MRSKLPVYAFAFPALLVGVIVAAVLFRAEIAGAIDGLRSVEVEQRSTIGVIAAVIGFQVLQVVVFVIPGEAVQIASGFLFGTLGGALLSLVGIMIGSSINYAIGVLLGRPFVEALTRRSGHAHLLGFLRRRSARVGFYMLFVIPSIPKDILSYVAGAQPRIFRYLPFILFSMVGRTPAIVGSAAIGASTATGNMWVAGTLVVIALVALIIGVRYRTRIVAWVHHRDS